ncbi:hypothetical protein DFH27DRAFT_616672 [Peziza echinospora]|nr:hypothetical protein DFH27DRAFT_616672 [Peziza echinospora]
MSPNCHGCTCSSASSSWSTTKVESSELFLEEFHIVTSMRPSNNYQHSNPQARKTNTP